MSVWQSGREKAEGKTRYTQGTDDWYHFYHIYLHNVRTLSDKCIASFDNLGDARRKLDELNEKNPPKRGYEYVLVEL